MTETFFRLLGSRRAAAVMATALAGTLLSGGNTFAQTPSNDSFETMRTNQGEAQRRGVPRVFDFNPSGSDSGSYYFPIWEQQLRVPPLPPGLGDPFPEDMGFAGVTAFTAAEVAREIFYGPYATLVMRKQESAKLTARVAAYREVRAARVRELTTKLEELRQADAAARLSGLAKLAAEQAGPLQELVAEAEAIRSDVAGVDANYRFFRFDPARTLGPVLSATQAHRLIKAMYHYPGLSFDQRQLLPEIAYATVVRGHDEPFGAAAKEQHFVLYLWPATARIRLPSLLPPALEAKVSEFAAAKEELKSELRDAILREQEMWGFRRGERLANLASQQAPRFAALEKMAEEIRVAIAQHGLAEVTEASNLPAELTQRVGEFSARKAAVQRELTSRLRQLRSEHGAGRFSVQRERESLSIVQEGGGKPLPGLAEFNASLANRYAGLERDAEELRRDIQDFTRANPRRTAKSVDEVATQFELAYASRENRLRYRDYHRAVLEPGLSPAQRSLLFQAAVETLDREGWLPRP